ncbi:ubiquinol oxidase subunit II [Belnapia sp. T6]|uniref:Ubiquinol oxidase subunit 2 n=1 Tax=Belnapia mucosa TaxID=2804532 RepID=A0ABS1V5E7_9PROT|nr:ubiquinol oxidase subunit II [Belnapia mucosa]MBL6455528.1 ubiquinol oxidase subunit II [Belnapia mucosa]
MVSGLRRPARHLTNILFLTAPLIGCSGGPLDPHGPVAGQQRLLIFNALAVMLAIVIPTILAAVGFAWWFREINPRAKRRPDFVYSGRVEIVMWAIPLLTVTFLGGLIWTGSYALDPGRRLESDRPTTEVQVVALDWKWLFIYPEQGIASVNELVVPAGAPVHFDMTSASVMNTFSIPQLGGMIYVMNGMVTQINLQADHPGEFYGRSAHFSGDGFSDMKFTTRAVPEAEFARWVETVRGSGQALDRAAYTELMRQSVPDRPFTYRSVEHDLFAAVTTQRIPPAPGPRSGRGGPGIEEKAER